MVDRYSIQPVSPMRRIIATRMTHAAAIPHYRLVAEVEVDALMRLRTELGALDPERRLTVNDLLVKACATALMDCPTVNLQWMEKEIHQYHSADISVVTAVPGGLSTPIIRGAETKSVWEISQEIRILASKAAKNELKSHEIVGGSFSISNLGMYDIDQFDAIINPPQCAILAVGRAKRRVIVAVDDQTRIATILKITLSADHRAIDGAVGAQFLASLRQRLENPEHMRPPGGAI
jgi:pyruvate dehydrogenase E2 component (dihydrolipoamide acetyltransferase)